MQNKSRKNKSTFLGSYVFLFVLLILAILVALSFVRSYYQDYQIKQEIANLEEKSANLKSQKIEILEELEYIKSKSFVENVAKSDLNLAKNGENVVIMKEFVATTTSSDRQEKSTVLQLTDTKNYLKWFKLFIGD